MAVQQAPGSETNTRILKVIKEGMEVYDRLGKKIGTVTDMYFGSSSAETEKHGSGATTAPEPDMLDNTFMDDIARVFAPDQLPQAVRDQLLQNGFIKINGDGLFSRAKYVMPNQIDSVAGNRVDLRISRDNLIKPGSTQE